MSHLYTIGYQGLDIETFISRLNQAKVTSIVDVRELPLSRMKGFSKSAFGKHLEAAGIAYVHVPALGCPKPIRNRFREDRDWAAYTCGFLAYLETQKAPVNELAKLANDTTVCLVCFEADYAKCHRTYVARAVHLAGAPAVHHITAGTILPDHPARLAV